MNIRKIGVWGAFFPSTPAVSSSFLTYLFTVSKSWPVSESCRLQDRLKGGVGIVPPANIPISLFGNKTAFRIFPESRF